MMELFRRSAKTKVERMLQEDDYNAPVVVFSLEALLKMKAYVDNSDIEFGWLCAAKRLEGENSFFVYDVFTCKQEISSVTTELHESGLQELAERLMKEGRSEELMNIRAWGHSHVNMSVFPSTQDNKTFEEYYKNCDYFIRMILNKHGDMKIDVADTEKLVIYYDVPWTLTYPETLREYTDKVEELNKQISALQEERDKLFAPVDNEIKRMTEEYSALAKNEIKEYGAKEKEYGYGSVKTNWHSSLMDDDDYYYGNYYTNSYNNAQAYKDYHVKVKDTKNGSLKYRSIDQILTEDEIYYCYEVDVENPKDMKELKKLLNDKPEFKYYTEADWKDLMDVITEYVYDQPYEGY